ncbi:MAG: helix-turn-helix domain-containing protein [Planctomycetes bacterium]|nr:helix-turn-helix domain-containing protein [Planctomycetota bacterium]
MHTPSPSVSEPLVPLAEAYAQLGIPVRARTVTRWCRDGTVPCTRVGGRWYVRLKELRAAAFRETTVKP